MRSADIKCSLGGHSAKAAANANSEAGANRVGLLWRAQLLYSNSLNAYVKNSEKLMAGSGQQPKGSLP